MTTTEWENAKEIKCKLRNNYGIEIPDEIALKVLDNPRYHVGSTIPEIYEITVQVLCDVYYNKNKRDNK